MDSLYDINGLMFWTEREIFVRNMLAEIFERQVKTILLETNPAWKFLQIEAPILTPAYRINPNYTADDIWMQGQPDAGLVLRPETTPGSYTYAAYLLKSQKIVPPFCVWQIGKSFRREQEQVTKNMRLPEFYQQEFQCFYTEDTKNDYMEAILDDLNSMFHNALMTTTRLVESDRLPEYSLRTMDVESIDPCYLDSKWMEICSISTRIDFLHKAIFSTKKGTAEKDLRVLEIAIGLDRCVYQYNEVRSIR